MYWLFGKLLCLPLSLHHLTSVTSRYSVSTTDGSGCSPGHHRPLKLPRAAQHGTQQTQNKQITQRVNKLKKLKLLKTFADEV